MARRVVTPGLLIALTATAALLYLAPFILLLAYAVPVADDFCKGSLSYFGTTQSGIWELTWRYYQGWSSRWLTTLLQSVILTRVGLDRTYGLTIGLLMSLVLVALAVFLRRVSGIQGRKAALLALIFLVVWLSSVRSVAESFFWLTVTIEYQLSLVAILIALALLLSEGRQRRSVSIAITASAACAPALNELAGAYLLALLAVGIVVRLGLALPIRQWIPPLCAVATSLAVVVLAPGPRARTAVEGANAWSVADLPRYLLDGCRAFYDWIDSPTVWLFVLWVLCFSSVADGTERPPSKRRTFHSLFFFAGLFLPVILLIVAETASGMTMPDRAIGWMQFLFWLFLVLFFWTTFAADGVRADPQRPARRLVVTLMLVVLFIGAPRFREAAGDAFFRAQPWRERVLSILSQRSESWHLTGVRDRPVHFPDSGLREDPAWWVNRCAENYLDYQGLRSSRM